MQGVCPCVPVPFQAGLEDSFRLLKATTQLQVGSIGSVKQGKILPNIILLQCNSVWTCSSFITATLDIFGVLNIAQIQCTSPFEMLGVVIGLPQGKQRHLGAPASNLPADHIKSQLLADLREL